MFYVIDDNKSVSETDSSVVTVRWTTKSESHQCRLTAEEDIYHIINEPVTVAEEVSPQRQAAAEIEMTFLCKQDASSNSSMQRGQ